MVIQCELCPAVGQTAEELVRHYSTHFASGPCKLCNKQLILIDGECHVLQLHNQGNCKQSHLCDPSVPDDVSDFGVIKTEIVSDIKPYANPKESPERKNLDVKHCFAVETVEVYPFKLIDCDKIKTEKKHIQDSTSEGMALSSDICNTNQVPAVSGKVRAIPEATNQVNPMKILNERSGNKAQQYHCEICGKDYSRKNTLNQHRKLHAEIIDMSNRNEIDKRPDKQISIKATGEKYLDKYKCRFCDKTFSRRRLLNVHRRVHTGDRPFKCNVEGCEKAYAHSHSLNHHLYTAHRIYKRKYKCKICSQMFHQKILRIKHMMSHG